MAGVNTTQIANELNLSRNTVSKALNNSPEVSEKTKQLVLSTAVKLGYKRINKQYYESYASSQTYYDICLMVHEREVTNSFWNIILQGIEEYLKSKKCKIIFGILSREEEQNELLPLVIRSNSISGIISIGSYSEKYFRKVKETNIPIVSIDTASTIPDNRLLNDTVMTTNESSVYEITSTLIEKGCDKIAFAGNPHDCKSIYERWKGFHTAMSDHNIPFQKSYDNFLEISVEHEYPHIEQIVSSIEEIPCAIVCANDTVANHIIRVYKKKNIRVPEDILVSGFDNYYSVFSPSSKLTTVDYNIRELGYLAARQILFRIERPIAPFIVIRTASTIIYRESTGKV
ncbi:MAG: LacI family DNA-binding transcriptional regulator [Saccharofermentanales bacterium]